PTLTESRRAVTFFSGETRVRVATDNLAIVAAQPSHTGARCVMVQLKDAITTISMVIMPTRKPLCGPRVPRSFLKTNGEPSTGSKQSSRATSVRIGTLGVHDSGPTTS